VHDKNCEKSASQSYVKAPHRHGNPVITGVDFLQLLERGKRRGILREVQKRVRTQIIKGMQDMEGRHCSRSPASLFHTVQITAVIVLRVLADVTKNVNESCRYANHGPWE
jgi:hypothetical protein